MQTWKNTYKYKVILALLAQSNLYWHISYTDYLGVFGGPYNTMVGIRYFFQKIMTPNNRNMV